VKARGSILSVDEVVGALGGLKPAFWDYRHGIAAIPSIKKTKIEGLKTCTLKGLSKEGGSDGVGYPARRGSVFGRHEGDERETL
jgi:hypothetical protein